MPLYDVTYKDLFIDPDEVLASDVMRALERKLHPRTYERVIKTAIEGVGSVRPSSNSKLVWTRSAALFGHRSPRPKCDVDHFWNSIISALGDDRECLWGVGSVLRYAIALRPETWLVYRQKTGDVDPVTGKEIKISEYWINDQYTPPH